MISVYVLMCLDGVWWQDDKNYYIISDYYMGGDVQVDHGGSVDGWEEARGRGKAMQVPKGDAQRPHLSTGEGHGEG